MPQSLARPRGFTARLAPDATAMVMKVRRCMMPPPPAQLQADLGFACPNLIPRAILAGFWRTEVRIQGPGVRMEGSEDRGLTRRLRNPATGFPPVPESRPRWPWHIDFTADS